MPFFGLHDFVYRYWISGIILKIVVASVVQLVRTSSIMRVFMSSSPD